MALKRPVSKKTDEEKNVKTEEGPNDHLGEEPIDAPVGYAPRVVQVPMNQNADVNPKVHEAKMEAKKENAKSEAKVTLKKGAGWNAKDERMYQHIKDSGASEKIAAATVNKNRRKEGRTKKSTTGGSDMSLNVTLMKAQTKGPGSRGGKIARYTKGGKPVYQAAAEKQAQAAGEAMHRWHDIADRNHADHLKTTDNPEHHAIAAKQALHAAYFHHHAGDSVSAHDAMSYANHHRAQYEKAGHKSRTTTAVEKLHGSTAHEIGHAGYDPSEHETPPHMKTLHDLVHGGLDVHASSQDHRATLKKLGYMGRNQSGQSYVTKQGREAANKMKKAMTPGNAIGGNMSKNEVADLFKSELGENNAKPITKCIKCEHPLTRDDLRKGLGTHFVADDNDQPHDGGNGQVEPSRVSGGKENDEIAPLLKGLKGPEAGDKEEYPISKSEMLTMGMHADELDDGWYTITKGEMQKQAPEHLAFLVDRKSRVAKSLAPNVAPAKKGDEIQKGGNSVRSTTDGPHGYSPRAGGVHGPSGESLVQWSEGSDAEVAKYIEQSGGFGPGTDESIRTQGRGY